MPESGIRQEPDGFRRLVAMDVAMWASRTGKRPGWPFFLRYLILRPGFYFAFWHRVARAVRSVPLIGRVFARIILFLTEMGFSSEIALTAQIGGGFYTPHPFGIVIGNGARIGRGVTICQNVTIGVRSPDETGTATLGDGAFLGAGSVLLGPITLGRSALVGANAVVLGDVPDGRRIAGNPGRLLPERTPASRHSTRAQ